MVEKLIKVVVDFCLFFIFVYAISIGLDTIFKVSFGIDLGYVTFAGAIMAIFLIWLSLKMIEKVVGDIFK